MKTRTLRRRRLELVARLIAAPHSWRDYNPAMTRRAEDKEWRQSVRSERPQHPRPLWCRLAELRLGRR